MYVSVVFHFVASTMMMDYHVHDHGCLFFWHQVERHAISDCLCRRHCRHHVSIATTDHDNVVGIKLDIVDDSYPVTTWKCIILLAISSSSSPLPLDFNWVPTSEHQHVRSTVAAIIAFQGWYRHPILPLTRYTTLIVHLYRYRNRERVQTIKLDIPAAASFGLSFLGSIELSHYGLFLPWSQHFFAAPVRFRSVEPIQYHQHHRRHRRHRHHGLLHARPPMFVLLAPSWMSRLHQVGYPIVVVVAVDI